MLNYQDENDNLKNLSKHYEDIVDLLCSYHKIKFVYQQAEVSYQAALEFSQQIEQKITEFVGYVADKNNNLDKFSKMLDELPLLALEHSKYCGELEVHRTTIEINQQTYQDSLQKLLDSGSSLDSWQKFSNHAKNIFLKQIQCWFNYMSPRKEIAQQLTASIRGLVEIEQAKSDRQLQQILQDNEKGEKKRDRNLPITIAVVGIGIGVAGVVSSSYTLAVEKPWAPPSFQHPLPLHPFFGAVIVSCLGGGILGGLAWLIARKVLKSSFDRQSVSGSQSQPVNHVLQEAEEVRSTRDTEVR
ncbi:hypothetical protein QUB70_31550 [Microcoleus sp. A003_D6]|uniref:hypothetical protein n=1 Tax=Microcoleus sp. A003_D6 TaxID=3055266 RepID=UPI002FD02A47